MRSVRFKQVDVFTREPFRGNPVAVVLEAGGLDAGEMQRIAAWTNLSETTFVLPPTSRGADYRLRIFTPRMELPFAGHPTIGSAHAVIEGGIAAPKGGRLNQECGAGTVALEVEAGTIWLASPEWSMSAVAPAEIAQAEQALGRRFEGEPLIVNVGPRWLVGAMKDAVAVAALQPDMASLAALSRDLEIGGATVYGTADDGQAAFHVRSFAPAHGIPEDPVCGSGNIGVAAYLAHTGQAARVGEEYAVRQGMQLGRDGRVRVRMREDRILLGGSAVTCVEGRLRL
ncbi:MAG TPA: PhzF family phenazine biosynthesis protein [Burkholderiales bacterium]|nr:PhzF family phenazine biosynthesis protein [Burkholderiales bacterium]